ncbi:MAG TPA: PD-(D/E)XK nuclease family protein, partial [Vicinamibacterales bacterium]
VNLSKGASGVPKPIRVAADAVSVGTLVSDLDDEEKTREHEETKRLLYVALTRARDRLYLASVQKEPDERPGRGSLATVLPSSVNAIFARAAAGTDDEIAWSGSSGAPHRFRVCRRADESTEAVRGASIISVDPDRFGPPAADGEILRVSVTADIGAQDGPQALARSDAPDGDEALAGTLVHRLFQGWAPGRFADDEPRAALRAEALIRSDERAAAADAGRAARRVAALWLQLAARADVVELLVSGERLYEVPFSLVRGHDPSRVLRGIIDCLVLRPDGSVAIVEFKTGRPSPAHDRQLDVYLQAVRAIYPGTPVTGRLIYPA